MCVPKIGSSNMFKIKMIDPTKWFFYLTSSDKESLYNDPSYKSSVNEDTFVVCRDELSSSGSTTTSKDGKKPIYKKFAYYPNCIEFYLKKYKTETQRHYYEIISDKCKGFKPYIDIDMGLDKEFDEETKKKIDTDLFNLVENIKVILSHILIENSVFNVLIYDSSYGTKISYHIVVDKLYVTNNIVLKNIIEYIQEKIKTNPLSQYIDTKVYKMNQQFRLLGSSKLSNPNRVKRLFGSSLETELNLKDFTQSLITFIKDSYPLRLKEKYDKRWIIKPQKSKLSTGINIDVDDMSKHHQKFIEQFFEDHPEYEIKSIIDSTSEGSDEEEGTTEGTTNNKFYLLILKRISPSYCEECDRIHENENPYLFIRGNVAKLNCRRSDTSMIFIIENVVQENIIEDFKEKISVKTPPKVKKINMKKVSTIF